MSGSVPDAAGDKAQLIPGSIGAAAGTKYLTWTTSS